MSQLDLSKEDYETMIDELTNSIQNKEELVARLTLGKETYTCQIVIVVYYLKMEN